MPTKGGATQRGYGYQHQKIRKALLPYAYGQLCPHCERPMLPGQHLDLDHTDDRTGYRGMAHRSCNRRAGAVKGNNLRRARRTQVTRSW